MTNVADSRQRTQALDCSQSFIVQAPAGSGKTELLSQRYLALLSRVELPESILAITFTRKAASEMRERIIRALKTAQTSDEPQNEPDKTSWKLSKQVLEHDRLRGWDILKNPQRMQIQTIDSFNNTLIKRMPSIAGLGADIKTVDDAEPFYALAAERTLELLEDDDYGPFIERYLLHLDGNRAKASRLIATMLSRRDQWVHHLAREHEFDNLRNIIEHSLEKVIQTELSELSSMMNLNEIRRLNDLANYALESLRAMKSEHKAFKDILSTDDLFNLETIHLGNIDQWCMIANWLMVSDHKKITSAFTVRNGFRAKSAGSTAEEKALFDEKKHQMKELAENLAERLSYFQRVARLPNTHFDDNQWSHLCDLVACLKLSLAQLKILFVERDRLDFQEVAIRAGDALDLENTDLALVLDYQIQHILIDEFQDTSQSQNQLLKKLTREWQVDDGKTLFLVGDPMQSIYRFREADVGLFLSATNDGIGHIKPVSIQLTDNFRSKKTIVDWVNNSFVNIFPGKEDIYRGAVTYAHSNAFDQSDHGQVDCLLFDDAEEEAGHLAKIIKEQLTTEPDLNIAILVMSRKHLAQIVPALQHLEIRYQATEIESLGDRPVIIDLQMLMRCLTDPADRIAWLALLRAPWCGLTLSDLEIIAGAENSLITDNARNQVIRSQLSNDGLSRLDHFLERISEWLDNKNHRSLADRLEACWLTLDGPALLDFASDLEATQLFFEMLSDICYAGELTDPIEMTNALKRLYAPPDPKGDPRVQIMTIHKSKGLQFDTVIVPKLNARGANDTKTLLRWMTTPDGLLMTPLSLIETDDDRNYTYLADIDKERGVQERKRLLYVACTRAKSRLILSSAVTLKDDEVKPTNGSMFYDVWPCIRESAAWPVVDSSIQTNSEEDERYLDNRLYRRQDFAIALNQSFKTNAPSMQFPMNPALLDEFPNTSITRRAVGIVVHRWLELIADNIEKWDIARLTERKQMIRQMLISEGVAKSIVEKAVDEVLLHLDKTLSCAMGQRILSRYEDASNELAIERQEEDYSRFYIIDRTYVDDDGIRWIVDYKTSTHEDNSYDEDELEKFLDNQRIQYQSQLENYGHLMQELDNRPIKLMLYFTLYQRPVIWDYYGT